MAEFSRHKSMEIEALRKERDSEKAGKLSLMTELDRVVKAQEHREQLLLQKMSLLLNAKKAKILELKVQIDDLQQGASFVQEEVQQPQKKIAEEEGKKVGKKDELDQLMRDPKMQPPKKTTEQINQSVREGTLQFLQS